MAVVKLATRKAPAAAKPPSKKTESESQHAGRDIEVSRNLRLLRAILDAPIESTATNASNKARRPKTPLAATTTRGTNPPRTTAAKSKSKTAEKPIVKKEDAASEPLPPLAEQRRIAMNSFNQSLKLLSAVVRKQQLNKQQNPHHATTSRSIPGPAESAQWSLHAECACAGLDVLRRTDNPSTDSENSIQKREQAAVLLLEKVISLEMKDLAYATASKIYEQYCERQKGPRHSTTPQRKTKPLPLPQLLLQDSSLDESKDFHVVCSLQSQVIRLAILQGPESITHDFVQAISLDTPGSPANVICSGRELGHLKRPRAGDNLRTIAQALSKLYSTAVKANGSSIESRSLSLSLFVEAQIVRLASWKMLDCQVELDQELWTPLERALKHFWHKQELNTAAGYGLTTRLVERVRHHLRAFSFSAEIPSKLSVLLAQLSEANGDLDQAEEHLTYLCSQTTGSKKLFYQCRLATIQLDKGRLVDTVPPIVFDILQCFGSVTHADLAISSDDMLSLVRLRKVCSQQLSVSATGAAEQVQAELGTSCLKLLCGLLQFCGSQLRAMCQQDSKIRQSLHSSVLKTIEAIIDVERYATAADNEFFWFFLHNLDSCSRLLTELGKDHLVAEQGNRSDVLDSLKIRLSNVFWRAHSCSDNSSGEGKPMLLAQKSIVCLDGLSTEALSKAALGPRLEKVASMHMAAHASTHAKAMLEQAIKHYIAADALVDAVEASLSKQSSKVWADPASLAFQLSRALHSYDALCAGGADTEALSKLVYDDEGLPDVHRAILLENQILYSLRKGRAKPDLDSLFEHAQLVMKLACLPQHCVWRLRFASAFAFHVSKLPGVEDEELAIVEQLLLAAIEDYSDNEHSFLSSYRPVLVSLIHLQHGLIAEGFDVGSKSRSLACLRSSIEDRGSLPELDEVIDNYDCLLSTLRAYTDQAMALHENDSAVICLNIRAQLLQCGVLGGKHEQLGCYISLARCQVRLDDLQAAKSSLTRAQTLVEINEPANNTSLELRLVEAEYHLACAAPSGSGKCEIVLEEAQADVCAIWPQGADLNSARQIERDEIVARGALIASKFAVRSGNLADASQYARQAAKISTSIWAALEKRNSKSSTPPEDSTIITLATDLSNLNISPRSSTHRALSCGAQYWPYLEIHIRSLKHASSVLSHVGLFDDALHYAKQLRKVLLPMTSCHSLSDPGASLAVLYAKSKQSSDAMHLLAAREQLLQSSCHEPTADELLSSSEAYLALGEYATAWRFVQKACPLPIPRSNQAKMIKAPKKVEASKVTKAAPRPPTRAKSSKTPTVREESASKTYDLASTVKEPHRVASPCYSFNQLRNEDRRRALLLMIAAAAKDYEQDVHNETHLSSLPAPSPALVQEVFAVAKSSMSEAWRRLCEDSMQAVFAESAIALPSKCVSRSPTGRVSFLQGIGDADKISPSQSQTQSNQPAGFPDVAQLLQSAHKDVSLLLTERYSYCSTEMIHALVKMEARISLLLTTMGQPFTISSTELVLKVSQPMDEALRRETMVAFAESATQDRSSLSIWPNIDSAPTAKHEVISSDTLKDLPSTWSVISLTLAEDNSELLLSKVVSGRPPFVLRIPLHRSNEGDGTDEFTFDDAQRELRDIVTQANSSSHDVRGTADKVIRAQWHADRERLDRRLELLLSNVESVWLGGFRGVLSPKIFDEKDVRQLGEALTRSLDKHLPSRRKGSASTVDKTEIHDHILEIFLALGELQEDDLDDAIIDLLYFVVDIFQFNGERNAYDEIDWDAMLVDVLDALRVCCTAQPPHSPRHTILILDKELESFPWESLPCLINHTVSRMPSLGSVFDRLTRIRAQCGRGNALGITKSTAHVSAIVNPSGDLTSTQTLFEPILMSHLPASQSTYMINAPPSEPQFSSLLSTSDILLYFGHGSGAQYIRGRTIRSLSKSAVAFLFGCSSARMVEHGVFESNGMPRYYMLGSSPAVVGCLWDVTDREIDRVALRTLSEWGLLDNKDERVKDGLKLKGRKNQEKRQRVAAANDTKEPKTLVEAVQEGRKACVLRYLCGAAVVMYGVPIVLED